MSLVDLIVSLCAVRERVQLSGDQRKTSALSRYSKGRAGNLLPVEQRLKESDRHISDKMSD